MTSPSQFLALRGRSQAASALLAVSALISLLSIKYELDVRGLMDRIVVGHPVSMAELNAADDNTASAAAFWLAALVGAGIAFIAWFHRAYENIERLGASDLRASRGWSIGAWFVPILNLVRPKQLMDDIWRASDPALPANVAGGWRGRPVPGLLHAWWALFLLGSLVSNVASRMIDNAETAPALKTASTWVVLAHAALAVAAVLGIFVVRSVTSRQEHRAERVGGGGAPPAAGFAAAGERPAGLDGVTVWPPISAQPQ